MQPDRDLTLDVIYDNWRDYNGKLQSLSAPLTIEQLALQPAPHMWPLGQIVHSTLFRCGLGSLVVRCRMTMKR